MKWFIHEQFRTPRSNGLPDLRYDVVCRWRTWRPASLV